MPWLKRSPDFPAVAEIQACLSSHKMKACLNPLWRTYRKPYVSASSGQGASYPFDTTRGTQNSMLQKVTMPDFSWKSIGIQISLCQLECEPGSPASHPEASVLSCKAQFRFLRCPLQLDRSSDVPEQTKVFNGYPRLNSRIYPRFLPQLKKNIDTSPSPRNEAR